MSQGERERETSRHREERETSRHRERERDITAKGDQLPEHIVRGVSTASNLESMVLLAAGLGANQSKTIYKARVLNMMV